MTFTILTGADIDQILNSLTPTTLRSLLDTLSEALVRYSSSDEQKYQPHRAVTTRPGGQVSLFMPVTTEHSIGVKIVGIRPSQRPAVGDAALAPGLQSTLTICDAVGRAVGILNAAELTAFRTALSSMLLYRLRENTSRIVVFGAGKQALWHIRLAMLLRGEDIQHITIVNRSEARARQLISTLTASGWPSHTTLAPVYGSEATGAGIEQLVASADAIFCTTPSTEPLFPAAFLASVKAREKSRFISAIGSYRLDMAEIDPELLRMVTNVDGTFSQSVWKGMVVVDTRAGCLQEAGELVGAGISPDQMLEVGEILGHQATQDSAELQGWLRSGFVVYKSVGIGIMDIAVGERLLTMAVSQDVGLSLADL